MPAVLVDLGGTYLRCGVWHDHEQVRILERRRIPALNQDLPRNEVWNDILVSIADFADGVRALVPKTAPIVFSFPGPVADRRRIVDAPTVAGGMAELPDIQSDLSRRTGRDVHILNDISAAAWHISRRVNASRFMVVTVSSGIGSKIYDCGHSHGVIDDVVYAGEIGHLKVDESPDALVCDCGGRGHLGAVSSGRGIERQLRLMMKSDEVSNEADLVPAARRGDAWAVNFIRERTKPLARVVLDTVIAAGVQHVVVIGGFAVSLGETYREILQDHVLNQCDYRVMRSFLNNVISIGEEDACLLGTAAYAARVCV
jgi:C7-cyclitol 7-kinase